MLDPELKIGHPGKKFRWKTKSSLFGRKKIISDKIINIQMKQKNLAAFFLAERERVFV